MTPHLIRHIALRVLFAAALLAALTLAGCGGPPPVKLTLTDAPLPNYTGVEPSVSPTQQLGGRTIEVVKFDKKVIGPDKQGAGAEKQKSGNKSAWADKYVAWFKENGWKLGSERQDVTDMKWMFGKDDLQCTMTFSYDKGLTLLFSAPPKETPGQSAAPPPSAPPAAGASVTR